MGDHRANIKIEFTIHEKTYRQEWGWINYTDEGDGVDRRVVEWFDECWQDARSRWAAGIYESEAEERGRLERETEMKELARLTAKYPASGEGE